MELKELLKFTETYAAKQENAEKESDKLVTSERLSSTPYKES
jgi:hypothetical protein